MHSSDDAVIATIAGIQTRAKDLTLPMKSLILKTEGPEALLSEVFEEGLFNPDKDAALADAAVQLRHWREQGYDVIPIFDERYPKRLRGVHEAPGLIFSVGEVVPGDHAVSVVGSRNAGAKEREAAADMAQYLVAEGMTVASGLAKGIDAAAHEAALSAGGRTVAIMGTGLDQTYPKEHENLRWRIEQQGQVITQFFPGSEIAKYNFPMRNATMSGYGIATIVIAASEKSGTKHQAQAAIGHGRALILTPGVVRSTTWGEEHVRNKDAFVAESPRQAVEYVIETINNSRYISELLA